MSHFYSKVHLAPHCLGNKIQLLNLAPAKLCFSSLHNAPEAPLELLLPGPCLCSFHIQNALHLPLCLPKSNSQFKAKLWSIHFCGRSSTVPGPHVALSLWVQPFFWRSWRTLTAFLQTVIIAEEWELLLFKLHCVKSYKTTTRRSRLGAAETNPTRKEMNPTRNQEVVGSIHGLAQWVKYLALLWAVV